MQGQDDSLFFRKGCEQIRKGLRIARAAHRNRGYSLDSSRFIKILKESKTIYKPKLKCLKDVAYKNHKSCLVFTLVLKIFINVFLCL